MFFTTVAIIVVTRHFAHSLLIGYVDGSKWYVSWITETDICIVYSFNYVAIARCM